MQINKKSAFHDCNENLIDIPPPTSEELFNLIQPSDEINNQRKAEFLMANINLAHLNRQEANELNQVLNNNSQAFSSTLQTMGHFNIVNLEITFNRSYSIKVLHFPIL